MTKFLTAEDSPQSRPVGTAGSFKLRLILFLFFLSFFAGLVWAQESPEEWFKKGIEAAETQDYEKAISCFKKTIALRPNHVASYSNIGYVYVVKEMWDEAIDVYRKALTISPYDARIHHDLGFSLYKKGILDEAIEEFKKGIALDSEFAPAYENIGILYAEKRMFNEAILTFKKALDISPDDPTTHFNLGRAYKALGDDILAADHYYQAGTLHLKKDNRDEALKAYKDLLSCSKEIAGMLFKKLYPEEKASDLITSLPSKKKDQWYVLLTGMNVRKGPDISSKILGQLEKDAEFQIIKEAPNNTPLYSWYLIRTGSGFSGWLCGIYKGSVKYKPAATSNIPSP